MARTRETLLTISIISSLSHVLSFAGLERPTPGRSCPRPAPGQVTYHWTLVDRAVLLQSAEGYEEAYAAMVVGGQSAVPCHAVLCRLVLMCALAQVSDVVCFGTG